MGRTSFGLGAGLFVIGMYACSSDSSSGSGNPASGGVSNDASSGGSGGTAGASGTSGANAGGTAGSGGSVLPPAIEAARAALDAGANEADLDGDGQNEYSVTRDANGKIIREEIDLDLNGTPELVWDRTQSPYFHTVDMDENGVFEWQQQVSLVGAINQTILTRDTNGNGQPDWRTTFSIDPASETMAVSFEQDDDGDGTFEGNGTNTVPKTQYKLSITTSGPNACDPAAAEAINDAFADAIANGLPCLEGMDPGLGARMRRMLTSYDFNVSCGSDSGDCGESPSGPPDWDPNADQPEVDITVHPPAFNNAGCNSLAATIFHEMMHKMHGSHEVGNGQDDPRDRTYGCELACFGGDKNNQRCAQCLGTKANDPRCAGFPQKPCGPPPAWCGCDNKAQIYKDLTTCTTDCPSGLNCQAAACKEVGPCAP